MINKKKILNIHQKSLYITELYNNNKKISDYLNTLIIEYYILCTSTK